ncbi:MAG: hypothetical protein ABJB22_02500 [Verrucomicrobiota bacterium]
MFPLVSDRLPSNAIDLAQTLEQSLRQLVDTQKDIVTVVERAFPVLGEVLINLDGARLRAGAPRPSAVSGETTPAFRVENFELTARSISMDDMRLDLRMHANNLQLHQGRDRDRKLVLVLHAADSGRIDVSAAKADLERLILAIAKREADKQGVAIEDLKLSLNSAGQRTIEGMVQLRARKLFLRGVIRIAARLEMDEKLTTKLVGLTCAGDGALGTLACNVLRPHLQRLEGRQFDLAALPLGDISLRDIEIVAGEKLAITAQFGRNV